MRLPVRPTVILLIALMGWVSGTSRSLARQATATYRVTFAASWSEATHPNAFPPNPHFSGLVGAVHNEGVVFWADGEVASTGIEQMAETGSKTALLAEVADARNAGTALAPVSGPGIGLSPGTVSIEVDVDDRYAYLTVVSMLAPSPDWFVGVSALPLRDENGWIPALTIPLAVYDAGTDSGPSYSSPNDDTQPPGVVAPLVTGPFSDDPIVGVLTVERIGATAVEPGPDRPVEFVLAGIHPNPARDAVAVRIDGDQNASGRLGVYDMLGRIRFDQRVRTGADVRIEVSNWPPGLYVVRAENEGVVRTRTFVVQR